MVRPLWYQRMKSRKSDGALTAAVAIMLGAANVPVIDSAVMNHPGICLMMHIRKIKVPTSWQCAEGLFTLNFILQ